MTTLSLSCYEILYFSRFAEFDLWSVYATKYMRGIRYSKHYTVIKAALPSFWAPPSNDPWPEIFYEHLTQFVYIRFFGWGFMSLAICCWHGSWTACPNKFYWLPGALHFIPSLEKYKRLMMWWDVETSGCTLFRRFKSAVSERFINSPLGHEKGWKRLLNFHAGKLDDISYDPGCSRFISSAYFWLAKDFIQLLYT